MSIGDPNRSYEEIHEGWLERKAENEAAWWKKFEAEYAEAKKKWAAMTEDERIFARMDRGLRAMQSRRGPHYNRSSRTLADEDYADEGN